MILINIFPSVHTILVSCFRGLRCHRTRIHVNLFVAISIHIVAQLIMNIDGLIGQSTGSEVGGVTIGNSGVITNRVSGGKLLLNLLQSPLRSIQFDVSPGGGDG